MAGISIAIKQRSSRPGLTWSGSALPHRKVSEYPPYLLRSSGNGVVLRLRVSPGSKKTRIDGTYGDALRIRVAAPPVDGKANQALIRFLADIFSVPKKNISLIRGQKSRDKSFAIEGLSLDEAAVSLEKYQNPS